EQGDEKLRREFQSRIHASRLTQAALLLEEQHAKAIEPRIAQCLAILRDIRAKAARAASTRGEKHARPDDLLDRHAFAIAQVDQMLHQIANSEIGGITLRAIAEFLAISQRLDIRHIERLQ